MRKILPVLFVCFAAFAGDAVTTPAASQARDLKTHHLFTPPDELPAWKKRAEELRVRLLVSNGLLPMPERTPLNPLVTGHYDGDDFTIDNVALETMPGFFLCGNLYKPKNKKGPFPAIANPHGHWANGRTTMDPDVAKPTSDERSAKAAGKANLVSIGVNLARQGFVVFAYDMIGYVDTVQLGGGYDKGHRMFGLGETGVKYWLHGISNLGLQTWNSMRVLDYLQSLPEVDKNKLGATGASGGGSQTFILAAIDERIKASVPVNMVSAYMQGGCVCENAPALRVGTDNAEIHALVAPRPGLLINCTGDWTSKVPLEEWPAVRRIYELFGKSERTKAVQFNYDHNYNVDSREAMYAFFAHWLQGKEDAAPKELPFELDPKVLRVWNDKFPMPPLTEAELAKTLTDSNEKALAAVWPNDSDSLKKFRKSFAPALKVALALEEPQPSPDVKLNREHKRVVLVVEAGAGDEGRALYEKLQKQDAAVVRLELPPFNDIADTFQGGFYTCYNRTNLGDRVQKILNALAAIRAQDNGKHIDLVGLGQAGLWTLFAAAVDERIARVALDAGGFDHSDASFIAKLYAPCLKRIGDVHTAGALIAPRPLFVFNTKGNFKMDKIAGVHTAAKRQLNVQLDAASADTIAKWLELRD